MSAKTAIPATSTERSGLSGLKRARTSSDSEDDVTTKRSCIYVLAPESDLESDSGTESILSIQDKSTDIVKSPTDTCSSYSWTSRNSSGAFIDVGVVSLTESDRVYDCIHIRNSSSTSEDAKPLAAGSPIVDHRISNSSVQTIDDESLSELEENDKKWTFKYCLWCKLLNSNPYFRYCQKCYLLRKSYLPMRPCRKRRQTRVDLLSDSCKLDSADSGIALSQSQSFHNDTDEMKIDPTGELCQICLVRRKDGGFCHGNIIHVYSCYKCSVRAYKQSGRCPVCNIRTRQIFKVVSV
ncbi:protein Mdm4-like [Cimex lectularius]|uniref:E3 ubiquitin-protein ligase Mdm2 n=1 Tax=Cimex lectularius TaxID=79782 RepID=A0A8I6S676_CIMLE|nr:protein Mdm4-like [Cimex lectularius]